MGTIILKKHHWSDLQCSLPYYIPWVLECVLSKLPRLAYQADEMKVCGEEAPLGARGERPGNSRV